MDKPWLSSYESVVPPTLTFSNHNLFELLVDSAKSFPKNTAARLILSYLAGGRVTIGGSRTYAERLNHVEHVANALCQL